MTNTTPAPGTDIITLLINRRVAKGHAFDGSSALLAELVEAHSGDNLAHALVYNSFIDARRAESVAARLEEVGR